MRPQTFKKDLGEIHFYVISLMALGGMSQGKDHQSFSYQDIEDHILDSLQIDISLRGRQVGTNRPWIRVWIHKSLSQLEHYKCIEKDSNELFFLTEKGVMEWGALVKQIMENRNHDTTR